MMQFDGMPPWVNGKIEAGKAKMRGTLPVRLDLEDGAKEAYPDETTMKDFREACDREREELTQEKFLAIFEKQVREMTREIAADTNREWQRLYREENARLDAEKERPSILERILFAKEAGEPVPGNDITVKLLDGPDPFEEQMRRDILAGNKPGAELLTVYEYPLNEAGRRYELKTPNGPMPWHEEEYKLTDPRASMPPEIRKTAQSMVGLGSRIEVSPHRHAVGVHVVFEVTGERAACAKTSFKEREAIRNEFHARCAEQIEELLRMIVG